jgi:hypothetical protein
MTRKASSLVGPAVSLSALDLFANAVGALAFLLLLFAVNVIEVARGDPPLEVLTQRLPPAMTGAEYLAVLAARGGTLPYRWSVRAGEVPEGLALDAEKGEIVGSPRPGTADRTFPLDLAVADARRRTASAALRLRVLPPPRAGERLARPLVLLTHGPLAPAAVGRPYQLYLSARGGSGQYRWSAEGVPDGMAVDATAGLLAGSPVSAGKFELVLRVQDEAEGGGDLAAAVATASLEVHRNVERETWNAEPQTSKFAQREPPRRPEPETRNVQRETWNLERLGRRALWGWLGYLLLVLANVAYLYLLRRRESEDIHVLLKVHNVNLIHKADGTTALNGTKEDMEAFEKRYRAMHGRYMWHRRISYAVLAVLLIAYTAYLLS